MPTFPGVFNFHIPKYQAAGDHYTTYWDPRQRPLGAGDVELILSHSSQTCLLLFRYKR